MNGDLNKKDLNAPFIPLSQKVPPPPPTEIGVRTMESDIKSVRETGGGAPQPYIPSERQAAEIPAMPKPTVGVSGYSGPEKAIFEKPTNAQVKAEPTFTIPQAPKAPVPAPEAAPAPQPSKKKLFILLGILVAVIALGVIGYFVLYPILFPTEEVPIVETPQATLPTTGEQPEAPTTPTAPTITHTSFFATPVPQELATIVSVDLAGIKAALTAATDNIEAGNFKEIAFQKQGGTPLTSAELLPIVVEGMTAEDVTSTFDADVTAFLWVDGDGAWPGYILKVKQLVPTLQAQNKMSQLETSVNFKTAFVSDPGEITRAFQNGKAKNITTRYQVYTQKGAALNYGFLGDYLILSTSYNGLVQIIDSL